ncbi:MAG: acetylxylan esterase [Planctomycetes bacterium]|nr:acetylxylan esterase [Planctomycetota bacterium]
MQRDTSNALPGNHPMYQALSLVVVLFTCLLPTSSTFAEDREAIESLLKFPLIDPLVPQAQVEMFCEARVPKVPKVESLDEWQQLANTWRTDMFEKVIFRGAAADWRQAPQQVEWLDEIDGGPGYKIKKLRYQILPGLWVPALLYEPVELCGQVPVIMNVNGHDRPDGKAAKYKQIRCINQAKRGMIALNVEWLGMGQLRTEGFGHYRMNQLDLCGTGGIAPFYLTMERGLDVLLSHEHADPERVAVAGLSGGGWQTIFISSLDTRVTLTNPVAGYSSYITRIHNHSDLGDSEQTPCDMATVADYSHLTAMMAPRATLLTFNVEDNCCFASGHSLQPLVDAATPAFRLYNQLDRLSSHVNHDPGNHNFEQDNRQALYRMLGKQFYDGDASFDGEEIASDDELKTNGELHVPLPADNADFNTLALDLIKDLPRERLPAEEDAEWVASSRERLAAIVSAHDYEVKTNELPAIPIGDVTGKLWKMSIDKEWTVPAVELTRGLTVPTMTSIVVADDGRASASETVQRLLDEGHRVLAVDPFYIGESKIPRRDFLFALMVTAVGERSVGIQASQLAAIARWGKQQHPDVDLQIVAVGERMSLAAVIAADLETTAIDRVELSGSLATLKEVVEKNYGINQKPEFFCFGLLEAFDIRELVALVGPREVNFVDPNERMKAELAPLKSWYPEVGKSPDPPR